MDVVFGCKLEAACHDTLWRELDETHTRIT